MGAFDGYKVYEIAEIVAPDSPDTLLRQADAWRELGTALHDQATSMLRHLEAASSAWSSKSGEAFFTALSGQAEQLRTAADQAFSASERWNGIAVEVADVQTKVTDIADDWAAAGCPMDDGPESRTFSVRARQAMVAATEQIETHSSALQFDVDFTPLPEPEAPGQSGHSSGRSGGDAAPPGPGSGFVEPGGSSVPPGADEPDLQGPPPGSTGTGPGPGPALTGPPPGSPPPPPVAPPFGRVHQQSPEPKLPVCPPRKPPPVGVRPSRTMPPPRSTPPPRPKPSVPRTAPRQTPPPAPKAPRPPGRTVPSVIGSRQGNTGTAPIGTPRPVNALTRPVIGQRPGTTNPAPAVKGRLIGPNGVVAGPRNKVRAVRIPRLRSGGENLNRGVIRAGGAGRPAAPLKPVVQKSHRRDEDKRLSSDGPLEEFWEPNGAVVPAVITRRSDWQGHRHDPGPVKPLRANEELSGQFDEREVVDRLSRRGGETEEHSELWRAPKTSPTIITSSAETTRFHDPGPFFGRGTRSGGSR
ncbi:hypothetical protein [Stackebrandtia nassauensis]|uniref:Outer membrane channel protein CpnT-like N-terminal domain-containing protein n=1 Tax=Stackebrandtia nassauensis (strain DSM 44728 / CIP 108903 / NRRL B-16338 / NBRC 102104 / LLR-40K-21) TaxID=446470 RepID=D3PUX3_STANL|nr:hypothetical protein [Stackebrandtia nassauensis]ADD44997.1 hypothetical protein Snas_5364 [Stackebrandtia nassauensis DSM 44728]